MKLFGKPRSKLGDYLDKKRIKQAMLLEWTKGKISQSMLSRMCSEKEYKPTTENVNVVLNAIRKHVDRSAQYDDFWM